MNLSTQGILHLFFITFNDLLLEFCISAIHFINLDISDYSISILGVSFSIEFFLEGGGLFFSYLVRGPIYMMHLRHD